jgi:class 3 adenylate cyclase
MKRGTRERLQAHLRELIEPKIAEHRGRVVKNTDDGFQAEFASVVDAVRCAIEVQRGMVERNAAAVLPEKRIDFRIGVNLGDVIAEEHDIFGDGVNVARGDKNSRGAEVVKTSPRTTVNWPALASSILEVSGPVF